MKQVLMACMVTMLATGAASAREDLAVLEPAQAIAMKNTARGGIRARFAMTVAAYGRYPGAVYLNSTADYRSSENLTFHLPPSATRALEKKLGGSLETVVGRRVIVDGILNNVPIYRTNYGRLEGFLRMQHTVRLRHAGQLIAVE